MSKKKRISFRVSEEELKEIEKKVKYFKSNMSKFMRMLWHEYGKGL